MGLSALVLLLAAHLTAAHYGLVYPEWRGDTLANTNVTGWSQWTYPCAGVPRNSSTANTTDWPLDGGSLVLHLHHKWTYIFVNLDVGLAEKDTFDIVLTPEFLNSSGDGKLCIPKLALPAPVKDGELGTLQVVTVGDKGSALYNCANIKFASSATTLSGDQCMTDANVTYFAVKDQTAGQGATACPTARPNAAAGFSVGAATYVTALIIAFAFGLTL